MVDPAAPGIKEFFKGRDVFITGGSGKYFCQLSNENVSMCSTSTKTKLLCYFVQVLWEKC